MYLNDGTNVIPSLFCKRSAKTNSDSSLKKDQLKQIVIHHYLELGADRHVVAKMLLHPINLFSMGLHYRGEGDKVCPDPAHFSSC